MPEKPVDPGLLGSRRGAPEANPLGLSLGFIEGSAIVSMRDRTLGGGLVVRALDLELAEIEFPLDLEGGAEEFQRRSTRLRRLVIDLDLRALSQALDAELLALGSPIRALELVFEGQRLLLEVELVRGGHATPLLAELSMAPGEPREIRFHVSEPALFAAPELTPLMLGEHLFGALRALLIHSSARAAESLRRVGPSSFTLDPVDALLWAIMPRAGWKVPQHDEAPISRFELLATGSMRLIVGLSHNEDFPSQTSPIDLAAQEERFLRAMAREDAGRVATRAESLLERGDAVAAFEEMRTHLDASGGPDVLLERLFLLGVAEGRLHHEIADLADDALKRDPTTVPALLALAAVRSAEGRANAGRELYERAGRLLREKGRRRASGLAFRAAAEMAGGRASERVRLLEEAIALRPDDVNALRGLVEELPGLGRASAAVRAARRLANLASDPETRVLAHVSAGELLRGVLADPMQAKREFERALKLRFDDPRALEGLARAVMDQGEPRRAAGIYERLIQRAEAAGDPQLAAKWSVVLGDLWRPLDPEAATVRYRRASELAPKSLTAIGRYAEACLQAGRFEAAIEGVERGLPLLSGGVEEADREAAQALRLTAGKLYERSPARAAEAVSQYEAALELEPTGEQALDALDRLYHQQGAEERRAPILGRLARMRAQSGRMDEAAAVWREELKHGGAIGGELSRVRAEVEAALEKDRSHRGLLDAWVEIAQHAGEPEAIAEAVGRRLLLDDPGPVRAQLLAQLGAALERLGRQHEATKAYEEAASLDAQQSAALAALVRIHRSRGDRPRLALVLERWAPLQTEPEARASLAAERASLLIEEGREKEAYGAIKEALASVPDDPERLTVASELALRVQDLEGARTLMKRRLEQVGELSQSERLTLFLDQARLAEAAQDRDELIHALEQARETADPASETGRGLAARLARELAGAARLGELAELQRRRGRVSTLSPAERAERFLEAARIAAKLGEDAAATGDAEEALQLLGPSRGETALKLSALALLQELSEAKDDPIATGDVLGRKARLVSEPDERERLFLEQARAYVRGGNKREAIDALREAVRELPGSLALAEHLGERAESAGLSELAASALGQAAAIAEARNRIEQALELHARAAASALAAGKNERAKEHDRRVLDLSPPGLRSPLLDEAAARLEHSARAAGDVEMLVELLARRAAVADRSQAAALLLETAELKVGQLQDERGALEALRRARELAPEGTPISLQVLDRLASALGKLGLHAEQAAMLVERAERAVAPAERAAIYLDAARVYASQLGDRGMALSRAQAAVRADAGNEEARQLRIALLREGGRREALAEALSEEAAHSRDAEHAADLWLEAAEVLVPVHDMETGGRAPRDIEQALLLARRAGTATPKSPRALWAALRYVSALGRPPDELAVLGQLLERDLSGADKLALRLRRVELFERGTNDSFAAQAELGAAIKALLPLSSEQLELAIQQLPPRTIEGLGIQGAESTRIALLDRQLQLTERESDWSGHVSALLAKVELAKDPETRADLRVSAGQVLEQHLGDAALAEREYLAALALNERHFGARESLRRLYLTLDRFEDLAQNLGPELLREVWAGLGEHEPSGRRRRIAELLWPQLEAGSAERAEVQLALADLYSTGDIETDAEAELLEQVASEAPESQQVAALDRLGVYYLEKERFDRYCEILRRRAERLPDDKERARAIAELGEALEWKLGDGPGAEREYRTALAIDPGCTAAKASLVELLTSQDRFDDIARDVGSDALEVVLTGLLAGGEREEARAMRAADLLAMQLAPDDRGSLWLRIADAAPGVEFERAALQRAASEAGSHRVSALDRLLELLEARGERGELANVLRQRLEIEPTREHRLALHLRLARLVLAMRPEPGTPGLEAIEEEAERDLRRVLEIASDQPEARTLLKDLYVRQNRFLELGRVLGVDALAELRAENPDDVELTRTLIDSMAELSEGPARASLLLELVAYVNLGDTIVPGLPRTPEQLYRAAIAADPRSLEAREGLRAQLEAEARYEDIADALGLGALRDTVEQLKNHDDHASLMAATEALALKLGEAGAPARDQSSLYVEVAALHLSQQQTEAAEIALQKALTIDPENPIAREEIRELLVAQGRLGALAEIDEGLVATTAAMAAERGDLRLQIDALVALADRRVGDDRADTLLLIAALEKDRGEMANAQFRLQQALNAAPDHALARAELENLLWTGGHYLDVLAALGPDAFITRAAATLNADPVRVLAALQEAKAGLAGRHLADALELSASVSDPKSKSELADRGRRRDELEQARQLWDAIRDEAGAERTRIALVAIARSEDDVDALIAALADAHQHTRDQEQRAALALERATLLALSDRKPEARALIQPIVETPELPAGQRFDAARLLVEDLLDPDLERMETTELQLKARALTLLTEMPHPAAADPEGSFIDARGRWLVALAAVREAQGEEGAAVAGPLEAALRYARDRQAELPIRARLQALYEEYGDWRPAEAHASMIAEVQPRADLWVAVSELRAWLDDRGGAKAALDRALELDPASRPAHESLLRLAEQEGEPQSVITRLEAWAEADRSSGDAERARRLLRAASLAAEGQDGERAALLAERAISLLGRGDTEAEALAKQACAILAPLGRTEAMVAILTRVLAETPARAQTELRIQLADLLRGLDRLSEATTVIEQGVHRDTPAEDPLVERLLADTARLEPEVASRRLLALADRLGAGPAARRLRVVGAARAEEVGDRELARQAWSSVVSEVGPGEHGQRAREALVRLAREMEDRAGLLDALVESVEYASDPAERAALLLEAAEVADRQLDDPARAEALIRRAMAERPSDGGLEDRLVGLLERRHRWLDLEELLAAKTERVRGAERAAVCLARATLLERHLHDVEGAARLRLEAHRDNPLSAVGVSAALGLFEVFRFEEAETLARNLIEGGALDDRARLELELLIADALDARGKTDEALARLDAAFERWPKSLLVLERKLDLLEQRGRFAQLATALEQSAAIVDPDEALRHHLAAARIHLERTDDRAAAENCLRAALAQVEGVLAEPGQAGLEQGLAGAGATPSPELPLVDLAAMAKDLGIYALRVDALRLHAQSMPAGPAQWRALLWLAAAEREADHLEAAEFTLRGVVEAVRSASEVSFLDRVEAERSLGELLLARGDAQEAAEALGRAADMLASAPAERALERAQVLVELSAALERAGQIKEALAALLTARTLAADLVPAHILEPLVEAAGPSVMLAEQLEAKARSTQIDRERGARLRAAAEMWQNLGEHGRALGPMLEAYEAEPGSSETAEALETLLYEAERWPELARHLERRLEAEDLTDAERATLLTARARVLANHLDCVSEALGLLVEARELQPVSLEILQAIADLADALGDDALRRDTWARLATLSPARSVRQSALTRRAADFEAAGELTIAAQCLEDALDLALDAGELPRSVLDRALDLHKRRGDRAAEARLAVRAASARTGTEAAALYFLAANLRLVELNDRRGAAVAFGAAVREAPYDLGVRRALIDLAVSLGDLQQANLHAHGAVTAASFGGRESARVAYLVEEARYTAASGDVNRELEIWRDLIGSPAGVSQGVVDELVARGRASLSAEAVIGVIEARTGQMPAGEQRGRLRLARSRLLEEPLGRHWEAQGEREAVEREDALRPDPATGDLAAHAPGGNGTPSMDDNSRLLRSMLDRSGRWDELADLEERRAAQLDNPIARSDSLLQVARFYAETKNNDRDRVRDALLRALEAYPDNVEALSRLARLEVELGSWQRAAVIIERLEALGGPAWPVPEFELLGAEVAVRANDPGRAVARLISARVRDPGSVAVLRALGAIDPASVPPAAYDGWLEGLSQSLDPILDRAELAEVLVRRAERALLASTPERALELLGAVAELEPRHPRLLAIRRKALERLGQVSLLLDALEADARERPEVAGLLLRDAFRIAEESGDRGRSARLAGRLAAVLPSGDPGLAELIPFQLAHGDRSALVRIVDASGGLDSVGEVSNEARARLAGAFIEVERFAEAGTLLEPLLPALAGELLEGARKKGELEEFETAIKRAFGLSAAVDMPSSIDRIRRLLEPMMDLDHPPAASLRLLEGVHALLPEQRFLAELLARVYRRLDVQSRAASKLHRKLLAEDPTRIMHLEGLIEVQPESERDGASAVLAFLSTGASYGTPSITAGGPGEEVLGQILHDEVRTALGEALALTALPLAAVLRSSSSMPELRRPMADDPRVAEVVGALSSLIQVPFEALVDPHLGARVLLDPGAPPGLVIGQSLLDDAEPAELRFHLARALMLLQLGALTVRRSSRRVFVPLLRAAIDDQVALDVEDQARVAILREQLGPPGLEALASLIDPLQAATDGELAAWMAGAGLTANRFGALFAGDLRASLYGLRRVEPRLRIERWATGEARARAVRRWSPISDLVSFVLSEDYTSLVSAVGAGAHRGARF